MTITLSPLSAEHLPELKDLWRDPDVIRYTNIPDLCSQAEATLRLERLLDCQAGLPGTTIFTVLGDGHFCGIAGCPPVDAAQGAFGLFYQLLSGVWRQGIGLSAARMALDELYRLVPSAVVYADVVAENTASIRILEQLGFVHTAVHPGSFQRNGQALDIWDYVRGTGIKKEECL